MFICRRDIKMNRPFFKASFIIIAIAVMLTVSCGPQEPPSVKKSRTIAAENIELKKQLAKSNKEIEMLKAQYRKKINEQKEQLQKCLKEKEALKEKSRQNIRNQVKGVLDTVLEENRKLREQNAKLQTQIEELEKQPQ
jgi:nitrogen fixation/metabolism regulation signal transduction histidine kinase